MKKSVNIVLGLVFVAFVGYSICRSQFITPQSKILLENIEALAAPEIEYYHGFYLKYYQSGCKICERGDGICNVHDQEPC